VAKKETREFDVTDMSDLEKGRLIERMEKDRFLTLNIGWEKGRKYYIFWKEEAV